MQEGLILTVLSGLNLSEPLILSGIGLVRFGNLRSGEGLNIDAQYAFSLWFRSIVSRLPPELNRVIGGRTVRLLFGITYPTIKLGGCVTPGPGAQCKGPNDKLRPRTIYRVRAGGRAGRQVDRWAYTRWYIDFRSGSQTGETTAGESNKKKKDGLVLSRRVYRCRKRETNMFLRKSFFEPERLIAKKTVEKNEPGGKKPFVVQ